MNSNEPTKISNGKHLSAFHELTRKRRNVTWTLTGFLLAIYLGNILLMSVGGDLASKPLGPETVVTVGIAYSIFVVIAGAVTAGLYSWWANKRLDVLAERARNDFQTAKEGCDDNIAT